MRFASLIYKYRWLVLVLWIVSCGIICYVPSTQSSNVDEIKSFLPEDCDYEVAVRKLKEYFPLICDDSQCAIIIERAEGELTQADKLYIETLAERCKFALDDDLTQRELDLIAIVSPGILDLANQIDQIGSELKGMLSQFKSLWGQKPDTKDTTPRDYRNPMRSVYTKGGGQASLIRVNISATYMTTQCSDIVDHVRNVVLATMTKNGLIMPDSKRQFTMPKGLSIAVSGTAGYGHDYGDLVEQSYSNTRILTILAIVLILLFVYRAPIGALIPMVSIGAAAVISIMGITIAQNMGVSIGIAEKIFVFVLMYGAGVDYSLLLVNRYRENLTLGLTSAESIRHAHAKTLSAILASGFTDALGMMMLFFSAFIIFKTTGPVVAMAIFLAIAASVTLVPAMLAIAGPLTFWPSHPKLVTHVKKRRSLWALMAHKITARPGWVLLIALVIYAIPIVKSCDIQWAYDALDGITAQWLDKDGAVLDPGQGVGNASAGVELSRRYWSEGEVSPVQILIDASEEISESQWKELSKQIDTEVIKLQGVENIRTLTSPLGAGDCQERIVKQAKHLYISRKRGLRCEVVLSVTPMGNKAIDYLSIVKDRVNKLTGDYFATIPSSTTTDVPRFKIYMGGSTAQVATIKDITQKDYYQVVILVLSVVCIVVWILLRDLYLTLFMVFAIALSYLATLGVCGWIIGDELDWKVQMFLFVVIAAVGVDYNIFLASRLSQESKKYPPRQAIIKAMEHTGPVISSCGLIMAATLGSLAIGEIRLLTHLGITFAVGMIIDTFVTRPILLPAFVAKFKRTGNAKWL